MNANMIFRLLLRFGPQLVAQFNKRRNTQQDGDVAQPGQPNQPPAPNSQNLQQSARMLQRLMRMFRI